MMDGAPPQNCIPMVTEAATYSTGSLTKDKLSELDQVRLFEKKYDPLTIEIIESLPIEATWHCLELGAGAGSMSYWLAGRAVDGSVLAADVDPRYLDGTRAPNLTVRQLDIAQEEFAPGSFDLILARAVFEHLPRPDKQLARAVRWLAPGGWLVVEDFYYLPSGDAPSSAGRALVDAYLKRLAANGADIRWARRLPAVMAQVGLTSVGARVTPTGPGQSAADDELIGIRLRQEGCTLVDSGVLTVDQLAEFIASLGRPETRDLTVLEVSAWGRRPEVS
jgi:SAM-dependent methyltransferase